MKTDVCQFVPLKTLICCKIKNPFQQWSLFSGKPCGGCRKFLLLFGRIGPLALRPCALARVGFFATFNKYPPNSIVIWWYDVIWCVLRSPLRPLARPCIFDASISCSQNPISPEDVIERTGFFINPHVNFRGGGRGYSYDRARLIGSGPGEDFQHILMQRCPKKARPKPKFGNERKLHSGKLT